MEVAMRALVTGFEPFGGDGSNPSWEAVARLPERLDDMIVSRRRQGDNGTGLVQR